MSWSPVLADADFLQLLLVRLLVALLGLGVLELPVVHDLAHRRPFLVGHLDQVQTGFASHLQRLGGCHDAVLLALGSDQSDGSDPDLFVHPRAGWSAGRGVAVERRDCESPSD